MSWQAGERNGFSPFFNLSAAPPRICFTNAGEILSVGTCRLFAIGLASSLIVNVTCIWSSPLLASRQSRFAVCLALFGQFAATFGLPMPIIGAAGQDIRRVDSLCGCTPSDRAAGRCCCCSGRSDNRDTPAADEPPSCCAKPTASSSRGATTTHDVKLRWVGGVLTQRCQGPLDRTIAAVAPLAFPPEPSVRWTFEWSVTGSAPSIFFNPIATPAIPDVPPPR